ncbi:MAG TPA: tetratricopeptide repeat protein [Candidatus Handelsmanbacteria bacterium]|nr:tetratricopeptide repeat protein [Candidatus Handelsmanbacteria bacterium]
MKNSSYIRPLCCVLLLAASGCAGPWALSKSDEATDEGRRQAMQYFIKAKVFEAQQNYLGAIVALRSAADLDPTSPTVYAQLAENYQRIDDMRMAAHFAREGLALEPGRLRLRRLLIQLYEREGDRRAAIEQIEELLLFEQDNWPLYRHLAYLYAETGQPARIAPLFKKVLVRKNVPPEVGVDIAGIFARVGEKQEAENIYTRILAVDPTIEDAWLGLAELKLSQGYRNEAMLIYRRAAGQLPDSSMIFYYLAQLMATEHDLEDILAEEDAGLLYRLGLALAEADKPTEATMVFEHIVGLQPKTVEHWLDLARYYIYLEDYDEANAILGKAVTAIPDSSELYLYWGIVLEQQEAWQEAIDVYRQALVELPGDVALNVRWGISLGQQGEWEQALAHFEEAVSADSLYSEAYLHWGIALERLERWEAAIGKLERAAELEIGKGPVLFYLASSYEQAARYLDRIDFFDRAVETFERLLESNPNDSYALNYLGYMYADKGIRLEVAVDLLTRAISLDPENGAFLDSLGWAYFRLGQFQQAEQYLHQALALIGEDEPEEQAVIFDHAGDIASALGKEGEARTHWQKVLELAPDNEEVRLKLTP